MLEIEKKESKTIFRNYSSRLARVLSKIRAGMTRAVEETFMMKLASYQELASYKYLEILVPYLNHPSEETVFGSNKIKEQHETMKLQNEQVMLS